MTDAKTIVPTTCQTPRHTIDLLRESIREDAIEGQGGARFVSVDTRVLQWLMQDAVALNRLVAAVHRGMGDRPRGQLPARGGGDRPF